MVGIEYKWREVCTFFPFSLKLYIFTNLHVDEEFIFLTNRWNSHQFDAFVVCNNDDLILDLRDEVTVVFMN